jgi:hypothetical protein
MIEKLIDYAVLSTGGLATVSAVALNWRNRRLADRKVSAEIGIDEATQSKIIKEAAHSVEADYLQRIADFRIDLARLNQERDIERGRATEWRNRLTMFEDFFFTKHLPWDQRMVIAARQHGWEIEDPPSVLEYMNEAQDKVNKEIKEYNHAFPSHRH